MPDLMLIVSAFYFATVVFSAFRFAPYATNFRASKGNSKVNFLLLALFSLIPVFNIYCAFFFLQPKPTRKLKKKKHPHLKSLDHLKEIEKLYKNFSTNEKANVEIYQFSKELEDINKLLEFRFEKESFSYLLNKYHFSLERILRILNESEKYNKSLTEELLQASQKLLKDFSKEVKTLDVRENKLEAEAFETARLQYLSDIKEESDFQRKKSLETLEATLTNKKGSHSSV